MDKLLSALDKLLERAVDAIAPYKWWIVLILAIAGVLFVYFGESTSEIGNGR